MAKWGSKTKKDGLNSSPPVFSCASSSFLIIGDKHVSSENLLSLYNVDPDLCILVENMQSKKPEKFHGEDYFLVTYFKQFFPDRILRPRIDGKYEEALVKAVLL